MPSTLKFPLRRRHLSLTLPSSLFDDLKMLERDGTDLGGVLSLCLALHLEVEAPDASTVLPDFLDRLFAARHGAEPRVSLLVALPAWQAQAVLDCAATFRTSPSHVAAAMASAPARQMRLADADTMPATA